MFGEKLRLAIKKCGYTQEDFAKLLNTSRTLVNQWINGKTPSTTSMKKISKVLNLPIDYFFEEEKQENERLSKQEEKNTSIELLIKLMDEKFKRYDIELSLLKKDNIFLKEEVAFLKKKIKL